MQPESPTPTDRMFQIITSYWTSRAVYVAAKLGLADLVSDRPRTAQELAESTSTDAASLYRVLRALASVGIFNEDEQGRFANTAVSEILRSGVPGSLRATAISELGDDHYEAWTDVLHSVRTGQIAFDQRFGMPVWDYYQKHPADGAVFNESMTGLTRAVEAAVVASYDFSRFSRVVDVGGGHGGLLAAILAVNSNASGVLFDAPQVVDGAGERLRSLGLAGRSEAVGGDFFASVPDGGDLYTLKWIIHDWDDERSVAILGNCRRAMGPGGRLLLVEAVVPPRNEPSFAKFMDLNMLVMTGGRERTEEEFRRLLASARFRLTRTVATPSPFSVLEAEPEAD